ncbi:MAG TPA: sulfotransferase [Ilumatobacteraceae bacterium]|nr:sulfotransferase [Ilumatobacteraceae bacterium]
MMPGSEALGPTARPPFPFIVGCGRSGSTLLRAMCDGHPDLAVPPESHFVVQLAPRGRAANRPFDAGAFVDQLAASERFRLWEIERDVIAAAFAASPPQDYPQAVRHVFGLWASARGKSRYADKTPVYVLHIRELARVFPEAVFVHLVRDGRDVACSFLELGWADSIEEAAMHWRLRVTRGRRAGRALPAGRYLELRYEDLVRDPGTQLRAMCSTIELPFSAAMLDHSDRAAEVMRTTGHPEYHRQLALPPTPGMRDWRRELSAVDVARFELLAGEALEEHGYERQERRPSASVRRDVAARWCRWQVHRVRRRVGRVFDRG